MGEKVTVEVEPLGQGTMKVTTPAFPNFGKVARNVQELGLAVREAVGWAHAHAPRVSYNDAAEPLPVREPPKERGTEDLICQGCDKHWKRLRRNGRKPAYCDTCHPLYLPHIIRSPQEVVSA